MRIRWKLPIAFALITLVFAGIVASASALLLRGVSLERLEDDMSRQAGQYAATLERSSGLLAEGVTLQELTKEAGAAGQVRFTLIDSSGAVLADSGAEPAALDNHSDRPEVIQAIAEARG